MAQGGADRARSVQFCACLADVRLIVSRLLSLAGFVARLLAPRAPGRQLRPSTSMAAATTRSGSKPNLRCSSLSGAEAPKVFMPMTRPSGPT